MVAMELICNWVGISVYKFSKEEILFLEADLFTRIYEELKEIFRNQYKDYFHLTKLTTEMENNMLEDSFLRFIIKDILSTEEYNLTGIACYTDTHEDVIQEVINGRNSSPSATLLRRSINLHRSVRRELYDSIFKKITT